MRHDIITNFTTKPTSFEQNHELPKSNISIKLKLQNLMKLDEKQWIN